MTLTKTSLESARNDIITYRSKFADDLSDFLANRPGTRPIIEDLNRLNITISDILDILDRCIYNVTYNDNDFHLTEAQINSLVNYCYRKLNKYKYSIFVPGAGNVVPYVPPTTPAAPVYPPTDQYVYYTDGIDLLRKGVRDSEFVVDAALTATGFDGVEDTDWTNIKAVELGTIIDIEGNRYSTIRIGTQEWTVTNLKTTKYADGTDIELITDQTTWNADTVGAYCWYDNNIIHKDIYGALYNWYAVNNARGLVYFEKEGAQQAGWRIPTDGDFTILQNLLGGAAVAGGKLKEDSASYWTAPNTGATNQYKFYGLPGGVRNDNITSFNNMFNNALYWASNNYHATDAHYYLLYYNSAAFNQVGYHKAIGCSVRCVRNLP